MKELKTWGGKSSFKYSGSVKEGTKIFFGSGHTVNISAEKYLQLLNHFSGRTVKIGTSRTTRCGDSVGQWLVENVTKTAIASYIGAILIEEGYAEKISGPEIKIYRIN